MRTEENELTLSGRPSGPSPFLAITSSKENAPFGVTQTGR